MQSIETSPIVAVDVGNSRVKLGLFTQPRGRALPAPVNTLTLDANWRDEQIHQWLGAQEKTARWLIASVHRAVGARILAFASAAGGDARLLGPQDLQLTVLAERPETVGMDRLVNAVAANRFRAADRPAIVVDVGSAITVDLVSAEGAFLGGAILPGIGMSARALEQFTDLLPLVPVSELVDPPSALGKSTIPAIRSGLFWGAVGGIRELIDRLSADDPRPQVFLTGGAAPAVADLIRSREGEPATFVPHLTLGGIALSAAAPAGG